MRIIGPHFEAKLEINPATKLVTKAPLALSYMRGWTQKKVKEYAAGKRWTVDQETRHGG